MSENATTEFGCQPAAPATVVAHPSSVTLTLLDPLPNLIPAQGISLLAGASNIGKTALLASVTLALRDGKPVFGHQPGTIAALGVVNADRGWERGAGHWFNLAGFGDVRYYSMSDDPLFDPRSLRRKFERTVRLIEFIDKLQLPPRSVVIVDPIGLFLGGNLLNYDDCAVACHEIRAALKRRLLTLIATAHSAKLRADKNERYLRLQDQILGSAAIYGFSDTQMVLAGPEETGKPYYIFLIHSHMAPPQLFYLERDEQGLFVPYSGADQGNCARVLGLFPDDGTAITTGALVELAAAMPLSRTTLFRVLDVLLERARIEKVKHGLLRRVVLH
jgi:AAA domain